MKSKVIGIYAIRCASNNKVYIGSSKTMKRRWNEHRTQLNRNIHSNEHLQNAFNLYGKDSFSYSLIETCNVEELIDRELYYVLLHQSYKSEFGFNVVLPGSVRLVKEDENRTKKKVIVITVYNVQSGEFLEFNSAKEVSEALDLKYTKVNDVIAYWSSDNSKSRKRSYKGWVIYRKDDYLHSIPDYNGNYKKRGIQTYYLKPVIATHHQTGEVLEFHSVNDCAKGLNCFASDVSNYIKKGWKKHGYFFKYKEVGGTFK